MQLGGGVFRAQGVSGELRLGYQVVARLGRWALAEDRVECTAADINEFLADQSGFALWLRMGERHWVWKPVEVLDWSQRMQIRITGSPEVRQVA
jgi:hypothetical protein